jgi:hypothetical protein
MGIQQRNECNIIIRGQNCRGLKREEELEELAERVLSKVIFALAVQETWRTGDFQIESRGVLFIGHGFQEAKCRRGSGGVGLMLGPAARKAWEAAGSAVHHFGERILAVRLQVLDERKQVVKLWLVSAYAPDSGHPAEEREAFRVELGRCFEAARAAEVTEDHEAWRAVVNAGRRVLEKKASAHRGAARAEAETEMTEAEEKEKAGMYLRLLREGRMSTADRVQAERLVQAGAERLARLEEWVARRSLADR